jgi:glycosyltransferase involved in cell wall biosynthesis
MTHSASPASASAPARIAVIVPCLNEEITIGKVVDDFRAALPEATVYVFDNNSTDRTAAIASERGAVVIPEKRPGKGFVVQAMLAKVDADYYLMVDGDDTYSAAHARQMLQPLIDQKADMTVGTRLSEFSHGSFRSLHLLGNRVLTGLINWAFGTRLDDMLSGYRGLTRELAKSIAILSAGFEVETELTVRTLEGGFVIREMPIPYRERPEGSVSKLRTFRDGWRVGRTIIDVTRTYRPFTFYGLIGTLFLIGGGTCGWIVVLDYFDDYFVEHVPLAVLATGCMILAALNFTIGLVLNTLSDRMRELAYLVRLRRG